MNELENLENRLQVVGGQARYYKILCQEIREQALEEAACVVDTARQVDNSLWKLAQAIRDLKSD